jgi:ABC-type glycerol-3-phosphate transport system substrate-binding protein
MNRPMSKLIVSIIAATLLLGAAGSASAAEDSGNDKKTKETVAMSQAVYEDLTEIQEMIEAKDYATAPRKIDDLTVKKGLTP